MCRWTSVGRISFRHCWLTSGSPPDHTIVYVPTLELVERLERGEVDAVLAVPPTGTVVRASKLKRLVLDSSTDSPFSRYVCCLLEADTKFVARNPVTTKRVIAPSPGPRISAK